MRWFKLACASAVTLLVAACASHLFAPSGPQLDRLERGEVHVARFSATDDSDIYKTTYEVKVPAPIVWQTTSDIPEWLKSNRIVEQIRPAAGADAGPGADIAGERYFVRLADSRLQEIVVRRDDAKRMVDIVVLPDTQGSGPFAHCTIRMRPFFENSTLVEAEVQVSRDVLSRFAELLMAPAIMIAGNSFEDRLRNFWQDLAREQRQASELALGRTSPESGRVHIVAIGVDALEKAEVWRSRHYEELRYAEDDAAAFFSLAGQAYPASQGEQGLIRKCLTGRDATVAQVGEVIVRLRDRGEGASVRPGDTVLFFFAGHIALGSDVLAPGARATETYAYLVTADSDPANLPFTAIEREEIVRAMRYSPASRCIFFCDACYSGGQRVRSVAQGTSGLRMRGHRIPPPGDVAVFAAAGPDGQAAELDEFKHGIFTHVLLEGLSGDADDDRDDYVSLDELAHYMERQVPNTSSHRQTPYVEVSQTWDLRWPVRRAR